MSVSPPPAPAPSPEDSASAKIRQEIRDTVLPRLQQEGKDPSSKDVYPAEVKALAAKFGVDYNTAKKAWDKVLREAGAKPAPPPEITKTVGDVSARSAAKPKVLPPPEPSQPEGETPPSEEEQPVQLPKEAAARLFAGMHKGTAEFLYRLAEASWGVKVQRPDEDKDGKMIPINDEKNPYYQAGSLWADVIDAYGIEMNKVLVLIMATVNTGQVIAAPLLVAQGEKRRKEAEARAAEEREKKAREAIQK